MPLGIAWPTFGHDGRREEDGDGRHQHQEPQHPAAAHKHADEVDGIPPSLLLIKATKATSSLKWDLRRAPLFLTIAIRKITQESS